ncbi:MAG TPA: hypothetical protein VHZ55_13825 [Bryobacteraceae bacterium]|nr:hypothetical protein [Bryobacteraceae bacterium]
MPNGFNFSIVNATDHDVKLPSPTVECSDSFDGYVMLYLKYIPSDGLGPMDGGGCARDRFGKWPSILERIKTWQTLGAGEALILKGKREQFFYSDQRPGKYEFWASYTPPYVQDLDKQLLFGSGIDFPTSTVVSSRLSFERKR